MIEITESYTNNNIVTSNNKDDNVFICKMNTEYFTQYKTIEKYIDINRIAIMSENILMKKSIYSIKFKYL
jgi:hypothetical protein